MKWKLLSHVQLFVTPWTIQSGILQARIQWVAFPFSRGSSQPRYWTQVSCNTDSLPIAISGKPYLHFTDEETKDPETVQGRERPKPWPMNQQTWILIFLTLSLCVYERVVSPLWTSVSEFIKRDDWAFSTLFAYYKQVEAFKKSIPQPHLQRSWFNWFQSTVISISLRSQSR